MGAMRISELAGRCGVPVTTLRYYERAGLLPATRTPSGYRQFGEDAVDRLAFIGTAKRLGLPLTEIADLLTIWETGPCREVKAILRPRLAARLEETARRTAELTRFAITLREALTRLGTLPNRETPCDPTCDITQPTPAPGTPSPAPEGVPVACALDGGDLSARVAAWRAALDGGVRETVAGGMRVTLPVERAAEVAGLAAAERVCCPFIGFHLHLDQEGLRLEIRAPAEAGDLLADVFDVVP